MYSAYYPRNIVKCKARKVRTSILDEEIERSSSKRSFFQANLDSLYDEEHLKNNNKVK